MRITDEMVKVARETFDDVSGSPLELATNDAWRAALEAALAVDGVALQGWQPIESAPAGIDIIGYWQNGEMHTGSTNGDEWFPMFGSDDASWSMPTHWQPLPQPPAASDREERR